MAKTDTLSIELDGKINLVTRKGKKTTREELDGRVCLEAILSVIVAGLDLMDTKRAEPDFLDEMIAERTNRNPKFPDILDKACSPEESKRRAKVARKRLAALGLGK